MSATAAVVTTAMFELAKLSLAAYFEYMRIANKSEEEVDQVYQETKLGFGQRRPYDLPDPK
jgi:hypothetical protein